HSRQNFAWGGDSRAGTGDTSLPSLQWSGPSVRQSEGSPRVRPRQFHWYSGLTHGRYRSLSCRVAHRRIIVGATSRATLPGRSPPSRTLPHESDTTAAEARMSRMSRRGPMSIDDHRAWVARFSEWKPPKRRPGEKLVKHIVGQLATALERPRPNSSTT